jgi:transcriptional regulator with XRE-family HTH domain
MNKVSPKSKTYKVIREVMADSGHDTLEQLSETTGINRGNLYRYFTLETRPSIDVLPILAVALEVPVTVVLDLLQVNLRSVKK